MKLRWLCGVGVTSMLWSLSSSASAQAPGVTARAVDDRDHVTIMEVTGAYDRQPDANREHEEAVRKAIAQEFLRTHTDDYDFIVAFTKFRYELGGDDEGLKVRGRYYGIKNDVQGIGEELFDLSHDWGSAGRLQGYIDMGVLSQLATDPTDRDFEQTLAILAHEFAHRWGAGVRFRDIDGSLSTALHTDGSHWSFLLQSHNSVLNGNDWRDNGDGTFTSIGRSRSFYSPLDLYLMGLLDKSQVPPFFLIQNADVNPTRLPETGATIAGSAKPITIEDIVAAEGERVPSAQHSPKRFKIGFVYLIRPGDEVAPIELRAINAVREAFSTRAIILTGGKAVVEVFPEAAPGAPRPPGSPLPPSSGPRTVPVDLSQGLHWLAARQASDGGWGDSASTRVRDTAATLALLKEIPGAFTASQKGLAWLAGLTEHANVDTVSRRLIAIAPQFSGADVSFLQDAQDVAGGWGLRRGDQADPFDTALALMALPPGDRVSAIQHLLDTQNVDGGWGIRPGSPSSILGTLAVLRLGEKYESAALAAALGRPLMWLQARQNGDGGFGDVASTTYETAEAILFLRATPFPAADLVWALDFIRRGQLADGSWNESVYETALAIKALKTLALPNLAVDGSSMSVVPDSATEGQPVTISAQVTNRGSQDALDVVVRFLAGDPATGALQLGDDVRLANVRAGAQLPVTMAWNTSGQTGTHQIFVVVDPLAEIEEFNETDNAASKTLAVRPPPNEPDLAVATADLAFAPDLLRALPQAQVLRVHVANLGRTAAPQVRLGLYAGDPAAGAEQIGEAVVDVPGRGAAEALFSFDITTPGERRYVVVADPSNAIHEADESNNQAERVLPVQAAIDLLVVPGSVTFSENPIALGRDLVITAQVGNSGTADAFAARVRVFIDDPGGAIDVATLTLDLPAGQTRTVSTTWRTSRTLANVPVVIHADPANALRETSEDNNQASAPLSVPASTDANLRVTHEELQVSSPVFQGGTATISIPVHNTGFADAVNVDVAFYLGVPGSGGVQIGATHTIPSLPAGAQAVASVAWDSIATFGDKLIYVVVDPSGAIVEFDEQDNTAFTTVDVLSLPDLVASSAAISFTPPFPRQGDAVVVSALVTNTGEQPAVDAVVRFFSGNPAAGGVQIGVDQAIQVAPAGHAIAQVPFDVASQPGVATVFVHVDPANAIPELNDTNNIASRTLGIQDGSVFFSNLHFSPNGDAVQDTTDFFFRLTGADPAASVRVMDRRSEPVREFAMSPGATSGSVTWDGRDALERVVPDGEYTFVVHAVDGRGLASAKVIVDNNSSPVGDAAGTKYLMDGNLTCDWRGKNPTPSWLADDSGLLQWHQTQIVCPPGWFFFHCPSQYVATPQVGVYVTSPDGVRARITPDSWTANAFTGTPGTHIVGVAPAPDGKRILAALRRYKLIDTCPGCFGTKTWRYEFFGPLEFWIVNADGSGLRQAGSVPRVTGIQTEQQLEQVVAWAPDGSRFAFNETNDLENNEYRLYVFGTDGSEPVIIDRIARSEGSFFDLAWSPDSARVIYARQTHLPSFANNWRSMTSDGTDAVPIVISPFEFINATQAMWLGTDRFVNEVWSADDAIGLWLFSLTGDQPVKLSTNVRVTREPIADPDGRWIVYTDDSNQGRGVDDPHPERVSTGIWRVDAAGNIEQLHTATAQNRGIRGLSWTRNGRRIAFTETVTTEHRICDDGEGGRFCGESFSAIGTIDVGARHVRIVRTNADGSEIQFRGFFPDGHSFLLTEWDGSTSRLVALGLDDGIRRVLFENHDAQNGQFTASGKYFLYQSFREAWPQTAPCYKNGEPDTWILSSLLNLRTDFTFQRDRSQLLIRGTAEDRHFASYTLEAAPASQPNQFTPIAAPSDTPAINEILAAWIPPSEGSFLVRLTATDLAGNRSSTRKRVTWGLTPTITNVTISPRAFSPNGDGARDSVTLNYIVLGPVNLQFTIHDAQNAIVRTIEQAHPVIGPASIAWDGRADDGQVVADGVYRIHVLEYDFFVTVDTTPPDVRLSLGSAFRTVPEKTACVQTSTGLKCSVFPGPLVDTPSHALVGRAHDPTLASWTLEVGDGANPAEWVLVNQGTDLLVARGAFNRPTTPVGDTIVRALPDLREVVRKRYRLTAVDQAGNTSRVASDLAPEEIILYAWDSVPVPTTRTLEQALGPHLLSVVQTIRAPVQRLAVQFRIAGSALWVDGPAVSLPAAELEFPWDNSALAGGRTYEVRLLARDADGGEYASNALTIHSDLFEFTRAETSLFTRQTLTHGVASLREPLTDIRLVMAVSGDPDIGLGGAVFSDPVTFSIRVAPDPTVTSCTGQPVPARYKAIGESGRVYYSNTRTVTRFGPVDKSCVSPGKGALLELSAARVSAADCGMPNPERVQIRLSGVGLAPGSQRLRIQDVPNGLLRELPGVTMPFTLELDTSGHAEGTYLLQATALIDDDTGGGLVTASASFVVDHGAPTAQITNPAANASLCPVRAGNASVIEIEGVAEDVNFDRYAIEYGFGETPGAWLPVFPLSEADQAASRTPTRGALANWNVSRLAGGTYTLRLKVFDKGGNVRCTTVTFTLQGGVALENVRADSKLISPNADGRFDSVAVGFTLSTAALVDAHVFAVQDGQRAPMAIRTLLSNAQQLAGSNSILWDGLTDLGTAAPDGLYHVVITARDACGHPVTEFAPLEVDATPPEAIISAPAAGQIARVAVELRGTVGDLHFSGYRLEVGEGAAPVTWKTLRAGGAPVQDGLLGTWNNGAEPGDYTLRLTATDTAGNERAALLPVTVPDTEPLITRLAVTPSIFSPNGDGIHDSAVAEYVLTAMTRVVIEITSGDTVVATLASDVETPAGTHTVVWNGFTGAGEQAADGEYTLRLTATGVDDPARVQTESVPLIVDATAPAILLASPAADAYLRGDVAVTGSVTDANIDAYAVSYGTVAAGPTVVLEEGRQSRMTYSFGTLRELADGAYVLRVSASDLAGNTAAVDRPFFLDNESPTVALTAPQTGAIAGGSTSVLEVTGTVTEPNLQQWTLRFGAGLDPSDWTTIVTQTTLPASEQLASWDTTGLADGTYTLSLLSADRAGGTAESRAQVLVDHTPPVAVIRQPADGGRVSGAFEIRGDATDANFRSAELEISEGPAATASQFVRIVALQAPVTDGVLGALGALPEDGTYTVRLAVEDVAGHRIVALNTIVIDTEPLPAPANLVAMRENRNAARLTWSALPESDVAGYNVYRGGRKLNASAVAGGTYVDPNLADGTHRYMVTVVDTGGLESERSNEASVTIDLTAPAVRIQAPANGAAVSDLVDIRGTAASADDFREYRVLVGESAAPAAFTLIRRSSAPVSGAVLAQWDTVSLAQGAVRTLRLEAEDLDGNLAADQVTVTIDNEGPATPVLLSAAATGSDVTVTWQGSGETDLAGHLVYNNDLLANARRVVSGSLTPYLVPGASYLDRTLPDGDYEYYVVAVDRAGNFSAPSNAIGVTVETRAPRFTIVQPLNGTVTDTPVTIVATTTDADVASVQYQIRSGNNQIWANLGQPLTAPPYTIAWDPQTVAQGVWVFRAVGTDVRGNTDVVPNQIPPMVSIQHRDVTAPAPPTDLSASVTKGTVLLSWTASPDADVRRYHVFRDSSGFASHVGSTEGTTTFSDVNVPDGNHVYFVRAADAAGNQSADSNTVSARVYAPVLATPAACVPDPHVDIQGSGATAGSAVTLYVDVGQGPAAVTSAPASADGTFVFAGVPLTDGANTFTAQALDQAGNTSKFSAPLVVTSTELPGAPSNLQAQVIGHNLARAAGTAVNVSSAFYDPTQAIDGDLQTSWHANNEAPNAGSPPFFEVVFPGVATVSQIRMFGNRVQADHFDFHAGTFQLFDASGTVLFDSGEVLLPAPHRDVSVTVPDVAGVRRVRFTATAHESPTPGFAELEVIGSYADPEIRGVAFDVAVSWSEAAKAFAYDLSRNGTRIGPPEAVNGVASASSEWFPASLAADNDANSAWRPAFWFDVSPWWQIEFPQPISFRSVRINWMQGEVARSFELQRWDGQNWLTVKTVTDNDDTENIVVFDAGVETSRLRIAITASVNGAFSGLADVRILGTGFIYGTAFRDVNVPNGAHIYALAAVNGCFVQGPSVEVELAVGDVAPPAAPTDLTAAVARWDVSLRWTASTHTDVAGYHVYRRPSGGDWTKVTAAPVPAAEYLDTFVPNGSYQYRVTAIDGTGNESAPSNEAEAIVAVTVSVPLALTVTAPEVGRALDLAWSIDPDAAVSGYRVYRSLTAGGPFAAVTPNPVTSTTYRDEGLNDGVTYYYVVRAVDRAGNESVASNEASGTPADTESPAPPVLLYPTDTAHPTTLQADTTPIAGLAEPGTVVTLLRSGLSLGMTQAVAAPVVEEFLMASDRRSAWTFHSGRGLLAMFARPPSGGRDILTVIDVSTGHTRYYEQAFNGENPSFAGDGSSLAYTAFGNDGLELNVIDLVTGTIVRTIPLPDFPNEQALAPDGKRSALVFDNEEIWIADLETGEVTELLDTRERVSQLTWLPHGQQLMYVLSRNELILLDLESVDDEFISNIDGHVDLSPDGSTFAYGRDQEIWLYDIENEVETSLARREDDFASRRQPVFSPDGSAIAYLEWREESETFGLSVQRLDSDTAVRFADEVPEHATTYWAVDRTLLVIDEDGEDALRIFEPGRFRFDGVDVDPGLNLFSAVAADAAGNTSGPADPIALTRDTSGLSDLVIRDQDVFVYPLFPAPGERVRVVASVRNAGSAPADGVVVAFFDSDDAGNATLIDSLQDLGTIGPGAQASAAVVWEATSEGPHRLTARVDPLGAIEESSETNNSVTREVDVTAGGLPAVRVSADRAIYEPVAIVRLDVNATNPAGTADFEVAVTIEDALGNPVASVLEQSLASFPYSTRDFSATWSTSGALAGDYRARATLTRSDGLTTTAVAPFVIRAEEKITVSVATDRAGYTVGEIARITGVVRNESPNVDIQDVSALVEVRASDGSLAMRTEIPLGTLLLGAQAQAPATWPAPAPGVYTAMLTARQGTRVLGEVNRSFAVVGVARLEGTLDVSPPGVPLGDRFAVAATIANTGTLDLAGVTARVRLVDPDSRTTLQSFERVVDLAAGASVPWPLTIPTTGLSVKSYTTILEAERPNPGIETLATATVTVLDVVAPVVQITSPAPGAHLNADVLLAARALDNASAVARVEFRIDEGPWQPMAVSDAATGTYAHRLAASAATEGLRTLSVRAFDVAGNGDATSTTDANPASVSFVIDVTPPVITVSGVEDGRVYREAVQPVVAIEDEALASQSVLLNGQPFESGSIVGEEGTYTLDLVAADRAGNMAALTIAFTIDLNEPPVALDQHVTAAEDTPLTFTLDATDPDGDALTFTIAPPSNGELLGDGPELTYRPNANVHGLDQFTYTASDGQESVSATVFITVTPVNDPPLAHAGADQTVNEGDLVTLDASGSSDIEGDLLTYAWTQVAGPAVELDLADPARPRFIAPVVERSGATLTFSVTAHDGELASEPAVVNVTVKNVNQAPVAEAGADQDVREQAPVTLDGTGSFDPDGEPLAFAWTQVAGPLVVLADAETAQPSFTTPLVGRAGDVLTFRLVVSDGLAEADDTVSVTVVDVNHTPVADAGADQTKDELTPVTLDGSASIDPDGDPITYAWSQVSGPAVALTGADTAMPAFTAPAVGPGGDRLVFRLVVTDDLGAASAAAEVTVHVLNVNDPPACQLARPHTALLWPPDHKLVPIAIEGVTDPEGDPVTFTIGRVTQDEPVNGLGDGDTAPDAVVQGGTVLVRRERSGSGNGRVYMIHFTAADGQGGACEGAITVGVPRDQKPRTRTIDDGQRYDSTQKP